VGDIDARFVADDRVNPAAGTNGSLTLSVLVFVGPLQDLIWSEVGAAIKAPTPYTGQNFSAMARRMIMRRKQLRRAICEPLVVGFPHRPFVPQRGLTVDTIVVLHCGQWRSVNESDT
jgi:hypothetical protein